MWTPEAQKQLQMYLQSTPSDQIASSHPSSTPTAKSHVYDDVFNNNSEDEHEHEHENENENDGNDTDSTVTDLDPHLDANRMQDFDNDSTPVVGLDAYINYQLVKTTTQELHIASPTSSPIKWIGGLYWLKDESGFDGPLGLGLIGSASGTPGGCSRAI